MRVLISKALLVVAMAFGFAQPANAQMIQLAACDNGGCTCHITGQTIADFERDMNVKAPPGAADMTLVTRDGEFYWSSKSPAQIDASYGGPGTCDVQLDTPIVPEDGLWRITVGNTDTSACPLFRLTGQTIPSQVSGQTKNVKWNGWFWPSRLMSEAKSLVDWTWTGGHSWRGVLADERLSSSAGATGASIIWRINLISPTEVTGTNVFEYDISSTSGDAVAQAMLQNMQCRTVTNFTARKAG